MLILFRLTHKKHDIWPSWTHNNSDFVYFNLSEPNRNILFGCTSHFLEMFSLLGFQTTTPSWFFSYLTALHLSLLPSSSRSLQSAIIVSQDSDLKWDLFSICICSLGDLIWSCEFKYLLFADDDSHPRSLPAGDICTTIQVESTWILIGMPN